MFCQTKWKYNRLNLPCYFYLVQTRLKFQLNEVTNNSMNFPKFFISFISTLLIVVFVSCGDSSDSSVTDQNPTTKTAEVSEPAPISQP